MTRISGTSTPRPTAGNASRTAPTSGFSLPPSAAAADPAALDRAAPANATTPAAPASAILTLQEVDAPRPDQRRNQHARKHATALLDLLAALQRDLLSGEANPALTDELGQLLDLPPADDPALNGLLRAIACRAAIELARRQMPQ